MSEATKPDYLTQKQIHILKLLYKFRFMTAQLLKEYRNQKSDIPVMRALKLLESKEYVISRYKKSYRLAGKATSYALAPKALIYLRNNYGLEQTVLHAYYKNKSVSDEFVDHHIHVLETFLKIRSKQPDQLNLYSKYEVAGVDILPDLKPDLYLTNQDQSRQWLMYVYENTQLFIIKKQLKKIYEFYETEESDDVVLVLLCKNSSQQLALEAYFEKLQDSYDIDFTAHVQTLRSFDGAVLSLTQDSED